MLSYTCPKCLREIQDELDHRDCEFSVVAPMLAQCKQSWVTVIGDSNQGKTTYLEALMLVLKRMQSRINGFAINGIGTETKMLLQKRGQVESTTSPSTSYRPEPILLDLFGFPGLQLGQTERRNIFLFDTPGEYLKTGGEVEVPELANVFPHVQVPWLIYELSPEGQHGDRNPLGELASNLVVRYQQNNLSLDGKSLVIIYTMSQRLLEHFPVELHTYLNSDPYFGTEALKSQAPIQFSLSDYMHEAAKVSKILEQLTANYSHGGALLLQLAKQHNLQLRFCMTESVGHDVGDGKFHDHRSPKRVLDPLFWTVFLEQNVSDSPYPTGRTKRKRILVLINPDLSQESPWYRDGYLMKLWQMIGRQVDVDFYFMGRDQAEATAPNAPPSAPPKRACSQLIGPIVSRMADYDSVLVVSNNCPVDIMDFQYGPVQDNITMLVYDEDARDSWSPTIFLRNADDLQSIKQKIAR
jgi:hypothetical protein